MTLLRLLGSITAYDVLSVLIQNLVIVLSLKEE